MSSKLSRKVYRIHLNSIVKHTRYTRFLLKFKEEVRKKVQRSLGSGADSVVCSVGYGALGFCCHPISKTKFYKYVVTHGQFLRSFMMYDIYILLKGDNEKNGLEKIWPCSQVHENVVCYLQHSDLAKYNLPIRCKSSYVNSKEPVVSSMTIRQFKFRNKPRPALMHPGPLVRPRLRRVVETPPPIQGPNLPIFDPDGDRERTLRQYAQSLQSIQSAQVSTPIDYPNSIDIGYADSTSATSIYSNNTVSGSFLRTSSNWR